MISENTLYVWIFTRNLMFGSFFLRKKTIQLNCIEIWHVMRGSKLTRDDSQRKVRDPFDNDLES
jgi:hypothetical protein